MVSVVNRLKNNIRILWLGLILVIWLVITRLNTQTASLTDVFPSVDDQTMSKADVAYIIDEKWSYLSTLKQYDVWTGATLRISFLVPTEEQQQFEQSLISSYWFFVTNHNTSSIVNITLPPTLNTQQELLRTSFMPIIDSIALFHHDSVDELRIEQTNLLQYH